MGTMFTANANYLYQILGLCIERGILYLDESHLHRLFCIIFPSYFSFAQDRNYAIFRADFRIFSQPCFYGRVRHVEPLVYIFLYYSRQLEPTRKPEMEFFPIINRTATQIHITRFGTRNFNQTVLYADT